MKKKSFKITFTNIHGIVMNDYIINLGLERCDGLETVTNEMTFTTLLMEIVDVISNNKALMFIDEQSNIISIPAKYFQNYVCKIREW